MIIFQNNKSIEIHNDREYLEFAQHYKSIHAAGGIVQNEYQEILMIFRLGRWDFPKGKVEQGESIAEAAMREVKEETGLCDITIGEALPSTYHTYELFGESILKETHWFRMNATRQSLVPQTEEDIQQATWVPFDEIAAKLDSSYASLKALWKSITE